MVTWKSNKQNVVARSFAEVEYWLVAHGICVVVWIKRLLEQLRSYFSPIKVYCANKAAIAITHNPVLYKRTKHIEVYKHFNKDKIASKVICMPYI